MEDLVFVHLQRLEVPILLLKLLHLLEAELVVVLRESRGALLHDLPLDHAVIVLDPGEERNGALILCLTELLDDLSSVLLRLPHIVDTDLFEVSCVV